MSKDKRENQGTTKNGAIVYSGPKMYMYNWDVITRFITRQLSNNCPNAAILFGAVPSASPLKPIRVLASGIEAKERENVETYNGIEDVIEEDVITIKNQSILNSWLFTEEELAKIQEYGVTGFKMQKHEVESILNDSVPKYVDQDTIYVLIDPLKVIKSMWIADNPEVDPDSIRINLKKSKYKNQKISYTVEVITSNNSTNKGKNKDKKYNKLKKMMNMLYY